MSPILAARLQLILSYDNPLERRGASKIKWINSQSRRKGYGLKGVLP